MNLITIRGKLVPSDAEAAACAFVRVRLYWAFTQNGLRELVTNGTAWDESGISFNNAKFSAEVIEDMEAFVRSLDVVLKTEDAIRLGLNGHFDIEIDTPDSVLNYTVTVTDGQVSCEEVIQNPTDKIAV